MKIISDRCARTAKPFFCFVALFDGLTECCNSGMCFRSLPFFARIFLARTNEDSTKAFVRHVAMVEKDMVTMMLEKRRTREGVSREDEEMFRRLTLTERARRTVPKERNPWLTPTKFCESDETEDEGTAPFWVPPGLPDAWIEETRIR